MENKQQSQKSNKQIKKKTIQKKPQPSEMDPTPHELLFTLKVSLILLNTFEIKNTFNIKTLLNKIFLNFSEIFLRQKKSKKVLKKYFLTQKHS